MPGGRPTVATEEAIAMAWKYLDVCQLDKSLPTLERLAYTLGISRESLYARSEFSDVLETLRQMQADTLIQKGLVGDYNPTMAKLLLSSKHGYVEKTERVGENPIAVILDQYGVTQGGTDARQAPDALPSPPAS